MLSLKLQWETIGYSRGVKNFQNSTTTTTTTTIIIIIIENARPWWNTWFLVHGRLALEMNRCLQGAHVPDWMTKGKTTLIKKDPSKRNCSKQLQTDNLSTNDVENTNSTNKGKDLQLTNKPWIVPWRTERMPQRIQRHSRITLHRSTHPEWGQDQTKKSSYGLVWIQKGIWHGPKKQENKLPQDVQNITWSDKLYRKNHEELESGADNRRKKLSLNKDPKRYFPRKYTITLTIPNSHDATNHILKKCRAGYKFSRSQEEINHRIYMDDIKQFAKNEKELETLTWAVRIYSQDIGMEFGIEKCTLLVMKSGKRHMTDGIELPNQDKIITLGENETYIYLGILEADVIKQVQMKDKIQKEYLRKTRKLLETKLSVRNLIKGINAWAVPRVRYPFWCRPEMNLRK